MKPIIVCSLNDPAGTNIRERLIDSYGFAETGDLFDNYPTYENKDCMIACSHKDVIRIDDLEAHFGESKYCFVSRHWAESRIPSLTAHFTGNFGENEFGGNPSEISVYSPSMLKSYFVTLNSMRNRIPSKYQITLEATHHGPTSLRSPSLFVELGSTSEQWRDADAASRVAEALMKSLANPVKYEPCAIALGGTHYSEKFNRIELETDIAFGPIVPKYSLDQFSSSMLSQMLLKSREKITLAAVDMKGLGKHKEKVMQILSGSPLEILRA